jgi:hypothetical protein
MCDVCGQNPPLGVGAMPGIPASFAYCKDCLKAGAHPYAIVVANTAMLMMEPQATFEADTAQWWQQLVADTLGHLGKTREQFDTDVDLERQEFAASEARANAEFEATDEGRHHCYPVNYLPQDGGAV